MNRPCSTGKVRFPNPGAARRRLNQIRDEPQTGLYMPINFRPCRKCGGYHLTSKTGKPWKHGKRRR